MSKHADNHRSWFATLARVAEGEVRQRPAGMFAALPGHQIMVWSDSADGSAELADEVIELARELQVKEIGWWSADSSTNDVTGPRLLARGFRWGWQPHWMTLDVTLDVARLVEHTAPPDVVVRRLTEDVHWQTEDLYVYDPAVGLPVEALAGHGTSCFAAFAADVPIGVVTVHIAPGGVHAGLYGCAVAPDHRNRGIGSALTAAACRYARDQGCREVVLNATPLGRPMYTRVGFASVGDGQTWWLPAADIPLSPVGRTEVELVEAIGAGDPSRIADAVEAGRPDLDATLRCGLTPIEIAVRTRQPGSARCLTKLGATLDIVSAWDLGWRAEAVDLLAEHPELANRRGGDFGATPLHIAIERDDLALVEALLRAGPDLSLEDTAVGSTALGWARYFGRTEMIRLLEDLEGLEGLDRLDSLE